MAKRLILLGLFALVACTQRRVVVVEGGREGWVRLGERVVNGRVDYDLIEVGRHEGRFRKVMFVVEHSAVEMYDVSIAFGDGSVWSPGTRLVFPADTRSRVIDLPGGERVIRSVQFKYGNLPGGGRARVELWAR